MHPQRLTHSGIVPGTFRNTNVGNQEPNEDRSPNDLHPEVGLFVYQSRHSIDSDPDEAPNIATGVQEVILFFSPGTSSGIQKMRSTSQPRFCSESTSATIEADRNLLAPQLFASKGNCANFNSNLNRVSKLPKAPTTTMPTFDWKSEKIQLVGDLFRTSPNIHNQLTEENNINYFHSLSGWDALHTFQNISSPNRDILEESLIVFQKNT